jgi:hypothetical protein
MNDFTQALRWSRVQALIVQDAVAHNEGPGANWVHVLEAGHFALYTKADAIAEPVRAVMAAQR